MSHRKLNQGYQTQMKKTVNSPLTNDYSSKNRNYSLIMKLNTIRERNLKFKILKWKLGRWSEQRQYQEKIEKT